MDKYKKLAANTLIFAVGSFSSKILSFLLMPYITRIMGTGDYGSADLVQQTANVIIPIVTLTIASAALRFALDKNENKADVLSTGIQITLAGFAAFLLFAYPLSKLTINDFSFGEYIGLIYIFVFTSSMRLLLQQFVRGNSQVMLFSVDGIIATATTLGFTILYLSVFKWGVNGYIFAIISSDLCSCLFLFVFGKLYRYIKFKNISKTTRREMIKYSVPLIPTTILWWIINVSDRYMVTYFNGVSSNGLYTAASKIPNFVTLFSTIFVDAWQLSAVDEYDSEDRAEFFSKVFKVYCAGIFTVSSALIFTCRIFTKILVSKEYFDSWQYVPVLIIGTAFSCLVNFLASVYIAEKKSVMAMVTAAAGAITNIILNLVLIPYAGPNGAAIATLIAFMVVFVTRAKNTRKYVKFDLSLFRLIGSVLIISVQTAVILCVEHLGIVYGVEAALFCIMLAFNAKPLVEMAKTLVSKFIKKNI